MDHVTIDVRERDEFDAEHVEHSINLPLSEFARVAPGVLRQLEGKSVGVGAGSISWPEAPNMRILDLAR